jgi:hypothetical protein
VLCTGQRFLCLHSGIPGSLGAATSEPSPFALSALQKPAKNAGFGDFSGDTADTKPTTNPVMKNLLALLGVFAAL